MGYPNPSNIVKHVGYIALPTELLSHGTEFLAVGSAVYSQCACPVARGEPRRSLLQCRRESTNELKNIYIYIVGYIALPTELLSHVTH